jgi:hypothetical protein
MLAMTWSLRRNTDEPNFAGAAAGVLGLGVGYRLWPRRKLQGDTFLKNVRLPPPANADTLHAGAPHPSFLYSRSAGWSQTRRSAEPSRLRFSKPAVCLRSAGRRPPEPDRPSRVAESNGIQVTAAPRAKKMRVGCPLRLAPKHLSPPLREGREWSVAPGRTSVWKNPLQIESRHINKTDHSDRSFFCV